MRSILITAIIMIALAAPAMADEVVAGELGTGTSSVTYKAFNIGGGTGSLGKLNHTLYNFDIKKPINIVMDLQYSAIVNGAEFSVATPVWSDGTHYNTKTTTVTLYDFNTSVGTAELSYSLTDLNGNGLFDTGERLVVALNYNDDFIANTVNFEGTRLLEMRDNDDPNWYRWGLQNLTARGNPTPASWSPTMVTNGYHSSFVYKAGAEYYVTAVSYSGSYVYTYFDYKFQNTYAFLRYSDTSRIDFQVGKTIDSEMYPSRVYVFNLTNHAPVFAESAVNGENINTDLYGVLQFELSVYDYGGMWWNTTVNMTGAEPYSESTYTVSVSPDPVGIGSPISVRVGSSEGWDNVEAFSYTLLNWGDPSVGGNLPVWIKKADGHWWQYDGAAYSVDWGTSFPSVTTTSMDVPGTYTIEAVFWEGEGGGRAYDNFTVAGQGVTVEIIFRTKDYSSGATVAPSTISVRNLGNSTVWYNETTVSGTYEFRAIRGQYYQWMATAAGYEDSELLSNKFTIDRSIDITLRKEITVAAGNNTCWVSVSDDDLTPLSGAAVLLSDGQYKTTGASGVVTFTVLEGATYQIDVSKSGYVSQTRTVQVVGTSNAFSFELSKQYVTTVPTTAPGELPTVDTRTDDEKDQAMMDTIRLYGNDIILLAIVATILGLIGLMMKGLK